MLLDITQWWQQLPHSEQVFWCIGLISNALFIIYVFLQFYGGHDHDVHIEHDNPALGILSIRGILAFGMFMGWTGLVVLRNGGSMPVALTAGVIAGLLAALLAWRLIRMLLGLQSSGTLDPQQVIGQTGQVHLLIPAQQASSGKVMVEAQGALRELDAVSEGEAIPTGSPILIVGLTAEGVYIATPFEHNNPKQPGK